MTCWEFILTVSVEMNSSLNWESGHREKGMGLRGGVEKERLGNNGREKSQRTRFSLEAASRSGLNGHSRRGWDVAGPFS